MGKEKQETSDNIIKNFFEFRKFAELFNRTFGIQIPIDMCASVITNKLQLDLKKFDEILAKKFPDYKTEDFSVDFMIEKFGKVWTDRFMELLVNDSNDNEK